MELLSFYAKGEDGQPIFQVSEPLLKKFALIYNSQFDRQCPADQRETGGKGRIMADRQAALMLSEIKEGPFAQQLQRATPEHLVNCFINLAILGLSLEKGFGTECYIQSRNVKIGRDAQGKDVWGTLPTISISGYGEVKMRRRAGQIRGIETPTVVYDCDQLQVGETNGMKYVNYAKTFTRPQNARIIACFIKILLPNDKYDYFVMSSEDIARLAQYSEKANRGKANALYTSNNGQVDTGFLIAKAIKHAFKAYPRLEIGSAVMEADDDTIEQPETTIQKVDTTTGEIKKEEEEDIF